LTGKRRRKRAKNKGEGAEGEVWMEGGRREEEKKAAIIKNGNPI
jgi:hypothetical protein